METAADFVESGRFSRGMLVLMAGIVVGTHAGAQIVQPRMLAAYDGGEEGTTEPLWETWLAVGPERAIAVYNWGQVAVESARRVGYAVGHYNGDPGVEDWEWLEEGLIRRLSSAFDRIVDPSIVYEPAGWGDSGYFVAAAFANDSDQGRRNALLISEYDLGAPDPSFTVWQPVAYRDSLDKPWLVRGQRTAAGREYYVIWLGEKENPNLPGVWGYSYLRTRDSWQNWTQPESGLPEDVGGKFVRASGQHVTGDFCAQPAINPDDPDGPLYVAYRLGDKIRFLRGVDDDRDPGDPRVRFSHLLRIFETRTGGPPQLLPVEVSLNCTNVQPYLPRIYKAHTVPWLAVDPTGPERL